MIGTGRFKDGRFGLVVVADFAMSATDVAEWRRSFEKAGLGRPRPTRLTSAAHTRLYDGR
jgi:hypothetical protein